MASSLLRQCLKVLLSELFDPPNEIYFGGERRNEYEIFSGDTCDRDDGVSSAGITATPRRQQQRDSLF
jgi:hypothetical protein